MNETFIYIWRNIKYWEWFKKSEMVHLFVYLLIEASPSDKIWKGFTIKRGQIITKQERIISETGLSRQTVRTCLKRLISTNEITIKTSNKSTNDFSLITICNYDNYQSYIKPTNQTINQTINQDFNQTSTNEQPNINQELTNEQPNINQELTISNNVNKDNNVNKGNKKKKPTPPIEKTQYLDSVFLKEDEYSKLIEKHGEADVMLMLEKLNWWKLDKQTEAQQKSGSDYAKINGWVSKWLSDEKAKIGRANEKLNATPAPKPSNAVEVVGDYSRTSF